LETYLQQVPHKEIPQDQEMVLGEDQVAVELVEPDQVQEVMLTVARVALVELVYQVQLQDHLSVELAVVAVEHS
jgi:hypothetical protein